MRFAVLSQDSNLVNGGNRCNEALKLRPSQIVTSCHIWSTGNSLFRFLTFLLNLFLTSILKTHAVVLLIVLKQVSRIFCFKIACYLNQKTVISIKAICSMKVYFVTQTWHRYGLKTFLNIFLGKDFVCTHHFCSLSFFCHLHYHLCNGSIIKKKCPRKMSPLFCRFTPTVWTLQLSSIAISAD